MFVYLLWMPGKTPRSGGLLDLVDCWDRPVCPRCCFGLVLPNINVYWLDMLQWWWMFLVEHTFSPPLASFVGECTQVNVVFVASNSQSNVARW